MNWIYIFINVEVDIFIALNGIIFWWEFRFFNKKNNFDKN